MSASDKSMVAAMKGLALDATNRAGQGHIGMAIDASPITYALLGLTANLSLEHPKWVNRDRFVMSAGHGSMALYSIMHLLGALSLDDIKAHKQMHSKTPSHPEIDMTSFVDATTGPLGQGMAMAVGMAISQKYLSNLYARPGYEALFDHHIYVLHGDGCLQEGVGAEALVLAGTWKLNKLIYIHDFNNMQIDSSAAEVNGTNLVAWFKAMGFNTIVLEGHEVTDICKALSDAKKSDLPTYIQVKTVIAEDTPFQNTPAGHNPVLTPTQTADFKKKIGLASGTPFAYEDEVYTKGKTLREAKDKGFDQ